MNNSTNCSLSSTQNRLETEIFHNVISMEIFMITTHITYGRYRSNSSILLKIKKSRHTQSNYSTEFSSYLQEYLDTPLHVAARHRDVESIKILVDSGANVSDKNVCRSTILY